MPKNDRYVVRNPDGGWDVKGPNAERASSHHDTQQGAIDRARDIVGNLGGGEMRVQGMNGQWRASDTIPPGHDPYPPEG